MGKFCKYCGKPLVGGRCDCPDFLAVSPESVKTANENAEAMVTQQTGTAIQNSASEVNPSTETAVNNAVVSEQIPAEPIIPPATEPSPAVTPQPVPETKTINPYVAAPGSAPVQGTPVPVPAAPSVDAGNLVKETVELVAKGFTAPVTVTERVTKDKYLGGLIFLGAYAFLTFLLLLIHLPLGNAADLLSVKYRALIGLAGFLIVAAAPAVKAGVAYLFGSKAAPEVSFLELFGKVSLTGIYACCGMVAWFVFGFFAPVFGCVFLLAGVTSWIVFSNLTINTYLKSAEEDRKALAMFITSLAGVLVTVFLAYLFTKGIASGLVKDLYGSFSSIYGLF